MGRRLACSLNDHEQQVSINVDWSFVLMRHLPTSYPKREGISQGIRRPSPTSNKIPINLALRCSLGSAFLQLRLTLIRLVQP